MWTPRSTPSRATPIGHQDFIIASLAFSSTRQRDSLEKRSSQAGYAGHTGRRAACPTLSTQYLTFAIMLSCLLRAPLSRDRCTYAGNAALNHRGSLEIARHVVRVPPNSSLKSDTPGRLAPHQSKYSYPLAWSSSSRQDVPRHSCACWPNRLWRCQPRRHRQLVFRAP